MKQKVDDLGVELHKEREKNYHSMQDLGDQQYKSGDDGVKVYDCHFFNCSAIALTSISAIRVKLRNSSVYVTFCHFLVSRKI